jgi:hypothetical protein
MATTMYVYDLITGEMLYSRPAQVVGGKEITESASATPVAPPADIPAGHTVRWTGAAWETVEDHRQKTDEHGTRQGGTPFWLPGDTHASPARYVEELGPLPEGAMLEVPAMTPEEVAAQRKREIMGRLSQIDAEKIRPTSAIAAGIATDFDRQKLAALEEEATGLRAELAAL